MESHNAASCRHPCSGSNRAAIQQLLQRRSFQQGSPLLASRCITLPGDTSSVHIHIHSVTGAWLHDVTLTYNSIMRLALSWRNCMPIQSSSYSLLNLKFLPFFLPFTNHTAYVSPITCHTFNK